MKILIVGGTGWLGGTVARLAAAQGHDVTVLARGRAPAGALPLIAADRNAPLPDLSAHGFEAVVDTSAYSPAHVTALLDALGPGPSRHVLISSVSVHAEFHAPITEDSPAPEATAEDLAQAEAVARGEGDYGAAYGPLKRSAELAALARLGDRATIIRPGLIAGPGDPTDRFTFWARRLDRPGPAPVPLPANRPVQVIDVRDLAAFTLRMALADRPGLFTCTGHSTPFATVIDGFARLASAGAEPIWLPWPRFQAAGLRHWTEVPLVVPDDPDYAQFLTIHPARALAAGLTLRPLAETMADLLAWDRSRRDQPLRAGMPAEKEAALLAPDAQP